VSAGVIVAGLVAALACLAWLAVMRERLAVARALGALEAVGHSLEAMAVQANRLVNRALLVDERACHRFDDAEVVLAQARELNEQTACVLSTPGLSRAARVLHCWAADHPLSPDCSDVLAVATLLTDAANAAPKEPCECPRATLTR
jgi:hypothetical protein